MKKISCVMCTYRRFTCVERSMEMFLEQDYEGEQELIIYNTDFEHPIRIDAFTNIEGMKNKTIRIIDNGIDKITKLPYTNVGAIRRDALTYATGDYHVTWDDDDIFLPWNNRQCIDGIQKYPNAKAWKPYHSFFKYHDNPVVPVNNTLEASVIVEMESIREIGFRLETASEGLSWFSELDYSNRLVSDKESVPSYSFNWSDPPEIAGHKQSGDIGNPNNFENHKASSKDIPKRPLQRTNIDNIFQPYYQYFRDHPDEFNSDLVNKYVAKFL